MREDTARNRWANMGVSPSVRAWSSGRRKGSGDDIIRRTPGLVARPTDQERVLSPKASRVGDAGGCSESNR